MYRKKNSLLFFLLFFINSSYYYSQNSINLSIHQDLKLLISGDHKGNNPGTIDFITRIKYEADDKELGFMVVGLEYEKAFLHKIYSRYGIFTGFTFVNVFNDYNFQITPTLGIGNIYRVKKNLFSWSAALQMDYFVSDNFRLSFLNQITQRSDLKHMYKNLKYRFSFFIGFEFQLFQLKKY